MFDSGNGCYKKAAEKYFPNEIDIYSMGLDIENRNDHFIHMDISDYSELFGESQMYMILDTLPKPDIILASPPCESFSVASAIRNGNVCWYTQDIITLFGEVKAENDFTIRTKKQLESWYSEHPHYKKHWWKTVFNRINGELCAFNTIRIIEKYEPAIWIIENPQSSRIWRYYRDIHNFIGIENVAHYNAYDKKFPHKPTTFLSNIYLPLKKTREKASVTIGAGKNDERPVITGYNERSNIPLLLIKDILNYCIKKVKLKER